MCSILSKRPPHKKHSSTEMASILQHMAESHKLPPTISTLKQDILSVHIHARVWGQAIIAQQELLDPLQNGFCKDALSQFKPTTTEILPASDSIIEMVRYQCIKDCLSQKCSCELKNVPCTDLCQCTTLCENDDDYCIENQLRDDENSCDNDL